MITHILQGESTEHISTCQCSASGARRRTCRTANACVHGRIGYGLCSYGMYGYGLCSYGLYGYGPCSYGAVPAAPQIACVHGRMGVRACIPIDTRTDECSSPYLRACPRARAYVRGCVQLSAQHVEQRVDVGLHNQLVISYWHISYWYIS